MGAYLDDDAVRGTDSGSAYLYRGLDSATGLAVTESAKLVASDGLLGDRFGISVAIDGDNFLIGALVGNGLVADSGKAYSGSVASVTVMDTVNIGALTGNTGNMLRLEGTANIANAVAFIMGENNILSIAGNRTAGGALLPYLSTTTLQVWDGTALQSVTNGNQSTLLTSDFSGGYTNFTTVPEPSALLLSALGVLGMIRRRRSVVLQNDTISR